MFSSSLLSAEDQKLYTVPVPEDPAGDTSDDCRLWIGNLDTRLTEFTLLKLLQKFGSLKRFDFLINKQGPEKGKPRGYCFVSYQNRQDAETAKKHLNGKLALSKRLVVKWAHVETQGEYVCKDSKEAEASSSSKNKADNTIRAIEAKLKTMEKSSEDFTISTKPSAPPGSSHLYHMTKPQQTNKPYSRRK